MAMGLAEALRPTAGGFLLEVAVTAAARDERFPDGFDPWRKRVGVRVRAAPEAGAANRAVCTLVRSFFAARAVTVERGHTTTLKTLRVAGADLDKARARLAAVVP